MPRPKELTRSDDGSTFTNLVVNGTPIDPNVPDNTVITLPGLGTVTLKEVDAGRNSQQAHETVDMLVVDVTKSNGLGLPVGAKLVIGHAQAVYERQEPEAILNGSSTGLRVNADAGPALQEAAGSAAAVGIPGCSGTNGKTLTKSVTNLDVAGVLTMGAITNTATGTEGKTSVAATSSTVSNVSLLGGLLTVSSVAAFAQETNVGDIDTPSTNGSGFVGLAIAGLPVDPNLPPNSSLTLPGIGSVIVNEQLLGAKNSVQVNGLHIKVTQQNLLGLTPGAEIIVAHAGASARKFLEGEALLFENKKQKTFARLIPSRQKFFCFFFFKKRRSFLQHPPPPVRWAAMTHAQLQAAIAAIIPYFPLLVACLAILLMAIVLQDAFEVMLLPRRVHRRVRLTRFYFRTIWWGWARLARLLSSGSDDARERFLAIFGPLSMLTLIAGWSTLLIFGFGLLQWAMQGHRAAYSPPMQQVYMSRGHLLHAWLRRHRAPIPPRAGSPRSSRPAPGWASWPW